MNIELYINNKLCDLEKSELSIKLKRQFFNPTELNTKDSQKSYNISLPSTPTNDQIFRYSNVEETEGKFATHPNAQLYINGILIFDGNFRLTQISKDSYQGNLGVANPLTVKDVFGERKMNEVGKWNIPDWNKQAAINSINQEDNPPYIFPFAMYGIFPKNAERGEPTGRDIYDENTELKLNNFPPSFNCIQMLQKIFKNMSYNLIGSATTDERLKNLYVSYRNPNDHPMDWGVSDGIHFTADWDLVSRRNEKIETNRGLNRNSNLCAFNILEGQNIILNSLSVNDKYNWVEKTNPGIKITIPEDGLYKIHFGLVYNMERTYDTHSDAEVTVKDSDLNETITSEIYLTRNEPTDTNLNKLTLINTYDDANRLYPEMNRVNFIDSDLNSSILCGFSIGKEDKQDVGYYKSLCNPIARKPASSESAVDSPGYRKDGQQVNKHKIVLQQGANLATRMTENYGDRNRDGNVYQIVWLQKGDKIGLVNVSSMFDGVIARHNFHMDVTIEPFRTDKEWINIDDNGNGQMNWNDYTNLKGYPLELTQFLPSESTINDWIDHFCKAFNLQLTHLGDNNFSLDTKDVNLIKNTSRVIDLDKKTNVVQRYNEPLGLPPAYELGFTIGNSEHGYVDSITDEKLNTGETGGGTFKTNSLSSGNPIKLNSNFSYCWYKPITIKNENNKQVNVPVIGDDEVWSKGSYSEMMKKVYFGKAQRFWYKKKGETQTVKIDNLETNLALVSNSYEGDRPLHLDYEDKPTSIMRNYFMLLTNEKNYTKVECYLTPEEYNNLDKSYVRFNGDLYVVAEADGYDPMGGAKTKLKLMKR